MCLYLSLYISFLLFGHFFFFDTRRQKAVLYKSSRKHTICMRWKFWDFSSFVKCKHLPVLIHDGLFFNSSPALDLKYTLRLPYIHFYFSLVHFVHNIKLMAYINISTNRIDSYILVVCQTTPLADNSDRSKGLVGP